MVLVPVVWGIARINMMSERGEGVVEEKQIIADKEARRGGGPKL